MPCIPGTGTCVALATVLTVGGIAATGADIGMEGARYAQGQESVFDFMGGRKQEDDFMEKCRKTGGLSSDDCPDIDYASGATTEQTTQPEQQQQPQQPQQPVQPSFVELLVKYQNIIAVLFVIVLFKMFR